ncbi:hypothetical protein HanRHA438_Chr17g0818421 [Helianthus annuus]|nr:hypothetical protein HanHA89_Chr17g0711121 [Helianthus annuus]KAJ0632840.1 hypothetical protein HanLR1_Chr17g0669701 [Helianthus annuus]KAJ0668104.1 hypothetical protein HanPI659440_Chr17g0685261 [Helianthus annuus]KAJ0826803.1 hypothetical protein HanRHA438_Chr17g0818421 [Helianthus annuus]
MLGSLLLNSSLQLLLQPRAGNETGSSSGQAGTDIRLKGTL